MRRRLCGQKRTTRPFVGVVVILSFLFAFFPGSAAVSNPAASSTGVICQVESTVHDAVAAHMDCGPSGPSATCNFHSACVSITVPTAVGLAAPAHATPPPIADADDPAGQGPFVSTPPPIALT